MEEDKLLDLLVSVKNMVKSDPNQARTALTSHPNLAFALMKEMVVLDVIDPEVLTRTLQAATGVQPPSAPAPIATSNVGAPAYNPPPQTYPPAFSPTSSPSYPPAASTPSYPPPSSTPTYPPSSAPSYPYNAPAQPPAASVPPHLYQARQQQQQNPPPPAAPPQAYQSRGPPPAAAAAPPVATGLAPEQQAMIQRLAMLTPEQISALPPADRTALLELRRQLGLS